MPRRARLSIPGIPWHIIQRGNNRSVCFHAEEDYQLYLHYLDEEVVGQIRSATNGNFALGRERFQREVEVALGRRAIRRQSGRPGKRSDKDETQEELL